MILHNSGWMLSRPRRAAVAISGRYDPVDAPVTSYCAAFVSTLPCRFGWLVWSGLIAVSAIGMHRNIKSARLQADAAAVTNKHTGVENPKHDNGPPPKTQFVKVGRNGHTNGSGVRFVQSDTARDQAAPMDIEHGTCQVGVYRGAAPNDGYGEVWRG